MYVIEPMTLEDVEEVGEVERLCFPNPWPLSAYRRELKNTDQNYYMVLRDDPDMDQHVQDEMHDGEHGPPYLQMRQSRRQRKFAFWNLARLRGPETPPPIIGFAGMWTLLDEAHVTTIGVRPEYRGRGLGELIFVGLIGEALRRDITWLTLEVRVTNETAQNLYRKYGFSIQGRRPGYYSDNNEDAFIMWSESLKDEGYRARLEQLQRKLIHKMSFDSEIPTP